METKRNGRTELIANQESQDNVSDFYDAVIAEFEPEIEKVNNLDQEEFITTARGLLRTIMIKLRHKFGAISGQETAYHLLPDPEDPNRENPLIVLGTGHCGYAEMGGCSMCSFGESATRDVSEQEIDEAFEMAKKSNDQYTAPGSQAVFNINAIGSFFGISELSDERRKYILDKVKGYKKEHQDKNVVFVTESRFEDITEESMAVLREELGEEIPIEIGFGVESTNDLVREAIVGKGLDSQWQKKKEILKKYKIDCALHMMFGLPFLNEREQVADSVNSVRDCLSKTGDYDRILLMVMNKKPGTLVDAMAKDGKYKLPNVAQAAEVVIRLGREISAKELKKILVFGLVFPEGAKEAGAEGLEISTSEEQRIMDILLNWRSTSEELIALEAAFHALQANTYDISLLDEPLPEIDEERMKVDMLKQYIKMLTDIYCPNEKDPKKAAAAVRGILELAPQMGGSI